MWNLIDAVRRRATAMSNCKLRAARAASFTLIACVRKIP
ncbi:hypothetical protein BSIN_4368 [Burkholderia singularis]|uniref:Uncharacterized protein n=1 Tax=Burkholderia singularis TaxID=1503053 RepID=A0A238H837_9BURK|nr:hypothetical protein BSIN_4368 [Burkholderia singularis]